MGRPREFEIDDALDAVMEAFWTHGYEATSLSDIIDATGLQKGSLYKAFGDKHTLFMRALDHYVKTVLQRSVEALENGKNPKEALRNWFYAAFDVAVGENGERRGCFAMNTLVELGPHDEVICERLMQHKSVFLKLLGTHIKTGQEDGTFRSDVAADKLAEVLFTYLLGLEAMLKGPMPREDARRLSTTMLRLLD